MGQNVTEYYIIDLNMSSKDSTLAHETFTVNSYRIKYASSLPDSLEAIVLCHVSDELGMI